jgi:hypothetical protein
LKKRTALILLISSWLRIIWTRKGINTVQHQNIVFHGLLKHIPWATFDGLVDRHDADWDERVTKSRPHLIAMLYAQFCGARGLREIEAGLKSHAGKLYHLGGSTISRSALSTANASRPVEVFAGLLSALMAQLQAGYRRKIGDCVRLIDSTSVRLNGLSGNWATFSAGVCGAKAHIIYDPDADQPLYLMVTPSNVNDITAAKQMPVEAGATYVFDLGYYDYGWWAELDEAGCRIVTRLRPTRLSPSSRIAPLRQDRRSRATGPAIFRNGSPPPAAIRCRASSARFGSSSRPVRRCVSSPTI